jgi:tetratricopeptide (TPR) repeat protein
MSRRHLRRVLFCGIACAFALSPIVGAAAEGSDASNVDLCNGKVRGAPDRQIEGCTALLKSAENPRAIAIIYNNRGNAHLSKGDYDLAIKDYGEAITADSQYPRADNNRSVA